MKIMKKPKLKFPKLKNATLCQIILYAPAVLGFVPLFIVPSLWNNIDFIMVLIILIPMLLSVAYLIFNFRVLIPADIEFSWIRAYKRDRKWFETKKNGKTRAEAEKIILSRMKRLGYTCSQIHAYPAPLLIKYYSHFSWTVHYARIEKICLLYSVSHLDIELYSQIINSAQANTKHLHGDKSKMFFLDKNKKKAPIASATVLIILADTVDDKISSAVRRNVGDYKDNVLLPCVADFSSGKYYFDSLKSVYIMGTTSKPVKNYAIEIVTKTVFGGKLPLRGNNHFVEDKNFSTDTLEKTLWDHLQEFKDTDVPKVPFIYKLYAKTVKAGEFKFKGNFIFCKIRKKVMAFTYNIDEQNENHLHITLYKKSISGFNKNLSKKEMETLNSNLQAFLDSEKYTYEISNNS